MSYCRHQNTANDLSDVISRWHDTDDGSASDDRVTRQRLLRQCKDLLEMNGCTVDVAGTVLD